MMPRESNEQERHHRSGIGKRAGKGIRRFTWFHPFPQIRLSPEEQAAWADLSEGISSSGPFRSPTCPRRSGAPRIGIGDTDWQRSYSVPDYQPSQSEDVTQSEGKRPW